MNPDFEADTEALRRDAAALDSTAERVSGAGRSAPVPDPAPRWAATGAAGLAATAAQQFVTHIGTDVAITAQQIRVVAGAYEEADARAAARMRPAR